MSPPCPNEKLSPYPQLWRRLWVLLFFCFKFGMEKSFPNLAERLTKRSSYCSLALTIKHYTAFLLFQNCLFLYSYCLNAVWTTSPFLSLSLMIIIIIPPLTNPHAFLASSKFPLSLFSLIKKNPHPPFLLPLALIKIRPNPTTRRKNLSQGFCSSHHRLPNPSADREESGC